MIDKVITIKEQLQNFVAHLNTYRKKRSEFLDSPNDINEAIQYYEVSEQDLLKLLKQ